MHPHAKSHACAQSAGARFFPCRGRGSPIAPPRNRPALRAQAGLELGSPAPRCHRSAPQPKSPQGPAWRPRPLPGASRATRSRAWIAAGRAAGFCPARPLARARPVRPRCSCCCWCQLHACPLPPRAGSSETGSACAWRPRLPPRSWAGARRAWPVLSTRAMAPRPPSGAPGEVRALRGLGRRVWRLPWHLPTGPALYPVIGSAMVIPTPPGAWGTKVCPVPPSLEAAPTPGDHSRLGEPSFYASWPRVLE